MQMHRAAVQLLDPLKHTLAKLAARLLPLTPPRPVSAGETIQIQIASHCLLLFASCQSHKSHQRQFPFGLRSVSSRH